MKNNIEFYNLKNTKELQFWNYVFYQYLKGNPEKVDKNFENNIQKHFFEVMLMNLNVDFDVFLNLKKKFEKEFDKKYKKNLEINLKNEKIVKIWINSLLKDKKYQFFLNKNLKFWGVSKKDFEKIKINIQFEFEYKKMAEYNNVSGSAIAVGNVKTNKNCIRITANKDFSVFDLKKKEKVKKHLLNIFAHELSHVIQYRDDKNLGKVIYVDILKKVKYKKLKEKVDKNIKNYNKLYNLVLEILNSSVASVNSSVFNIIYFNDKKNNISQENIQMLENFQYVEYVRKNLKSKNNYKGDLKSAVIIESVFHVYKDVLEYFKKGKKVDEFLVEKVVDLILKHEKEFLNYK